MKFKNILSIVLVAAMCIALLGACGENKNTDNLSSTFTTESNSVSGKTITIVCGAADEGFFEMLKKGGEDAAKKYSFSLEYVGVEDTEQSDSATHINKLQKVLEKDPAGVVLNPMGDGYADILSDFYDKKIPVVQVNSANEEDIETLEIRNKNPIVSTVSTDYKQAGAVCAEKLFEKVKEEIKKSQGTYVVGVVEREEVELDEEKSYGFTEKLSELADADDGTRGKYKIEVEDGADALGKLMTENVGAIFMTAPEIADKLSDVVSADKEKYKNIIFCGCDSGAKQLKWLEAEGVGAFIGGVAQDPYNLGFNAVEQCVFSVQGKELKPEIRIEAHWYDKSNVDKLMQDKLLFQK